MTLFFLGCNHPHIISQLDVPLMMSVNGLFKQKKNRKGYLRCLDLYGDRLKAGAWVGVGSVCKRNNSPESLRIVLDTIKQARPDLRLHGFGVKRTALQDAEIQAMLYSADSQAGTLTSGGYGKPAKTKKYEFANDWVGAVAYAKRVAQIKQQEQEKQLSLSL